MDPHRAERVTEALREELSELIALEMSDPRLEGVQVSAVHLSPDLKQASIRLNIPDEKPQALEAINNAKSFIKRQLAQRIDLYRIPELRFEREFSSPRVEHLLRRVRRGRPRGASAEKMEKTQ